MQLPGPRRGALRRRLAGSAVLATGAVYRLVVTPYAGDSTGFVEKWRKHLEWADPRYHFGFGYGADMNGLGAQGDPRGADARNPVTYPFTGLGGVTVNRQRSSSRVYDVDKDGVAHYGLYPDWVRDLRKLAGNDIVTDMSRGPEAFLQMWERADGVGNDGCRDARATKPASPAQARVRPDRSPPADRLGPGRPGPGACRARRCR